MRPGVGVCSEIRTASHYFEHNHPCPIPNRTSTLTVGQKKSNGHPEIRTLAQKFEQTVEVHQDSSLSLRVGLVPPPRPPPSRAAVRTGVRPHISCHSKFRGPDERSNGRSKRGECAGHMGRGGSW